jgi:RNA polymerase sigma-70 factor (ECF subfamily)
MSDYELLRAYLEGSEEAFNELYMRYERDIRNVISRFTSANLKDERADTCQYFWLEFHRYCHSYDPNRPFRNWIISCAVKACARYYRDCMPKTKCSLADQKKRFPLEEIIGPPTESVEPEEAMIQKEQAGQVRKALDRIRPEFRNVIQAVYFNGERPVDYARRADVALGTVYTQLNRGLERLRQAVVRHNNLSDLEPI